MNCNTIEKTDYKISDDIAYLKIGTAITKSELTTIAKEFKDQKNIDIDFSKSTFDADGKIDKVNLSVNCNDGNSGSTSSTFNGNRIGFIRDYNPDADSIFSIGGL